MSLTKKPPGETNENIFLVSKDIPDIRALHDF